MTSDPGPLWTLQEAQDTLRRVRAGVCACCGGPADDGFEWIGEGVKMCHSLCFDPPRHDHLWCAEAIRDLINHALRSESLSHSGEG